MTRTDDPGTAGRRVLIVDDDVDYADGLADLLGAEGYDVRAANTVEDALALIESFDAAVAILDFKLDAGADGLSLIDPLKARRPQLLCILSTAYSNFDLVVRSLRTGVYDYLRKPVAGAQLLVTLDRCFEFLALAEEKRQVEEKLQDANRQAAVAQVAGGVAHHFNNLLMIMQWRLEELRASLPAGGEQQEIVDDLVDKTDEAAKINYNLLSFTGLRWLSPERIEPKAALAARKAGLDRIAGHGRRLELALAPALWPIKADRAQFEAALGDLVDNAARAEPRDGRIVIRADNLSVAADDARFGGDLAPGRYVEFAVVDRGVGMSKEVAAMAIQPFYSGRGLAESTGLGLSTIYGFAKQSGGLMALETEQGAGTTVRLILPAFEDDDASGE